MIKTTSLQLSKDLKSAGFPQEGMFWYDGDTLVAKAMLGFFVEINSDKTMLGCGATSGEPDIWPEEEAEELIYAPTADEILEILPHYLPKRHNGYPFEMWINKHNGDWNIGYQTVKGYPFMSWCEKTLAEVAGKAYLYLAKEGLLSQ